MQAEIETTDMSIQDFQVDQEMAQEGEPKPDGSTPSVVEPNEENQREVADNDVVEDSPSMDAEHQNVSPGTDEEASTSGQMAKEIDHDQAATMIQRRARGMKERQTVADMKQHGQLPGQMRLKKVSCPHCDRNKVLSAGFHCRSAYVCMYAYMYEERLVFGFREIVSQTACMITSKTVAAINMPRRVCGSQSPHVKKNKSG